ncbi:MAG: 6,7-dimethyl-8-ribityllumazine synthase [Acidobacteriota bacterium]
MVETVEGRLDGRGLHFGIVLPRYNEPFGRRLLQGAVDCLVRHGVEEGDLTVVRVPGAYELPHAVRLLLASRPLNGVLALGVLIRGATSHYDLVAAEVCRGIGELSRSGGPPVVYGVVPAESQDQALERCGGKLGNRGWDAALSALEMARLSESLGALHRTKRRR